jgi:hypothetical protein
LHFHWLRKHTVKIQDAEVILILSTDPWAPLHHQ